MSTPASRHIPPHLREAIFRTYEPHLTLAVDNWPQETPFTIPPNVAPTTFVANFRNAILSIKLFDWEPTTVNKLKLWEMVQEKAFFIDREGERTCWFRQRQPKRGSMPLLLDKARLVTGKPDPVPSLVPWRDPTVAEIMALCLLINNNRVSGPVLFVGQLENQIVQDMETLYNVSFIYDEVRRVTVLT